MSDVASLRIVSQRQSADRVILLPVTPSEDAMLRRLAQFERLGASLAPTMVILKEEIRSRDRRDTIREPLEPRS